MDFVLAAVIVLLASTGLWLWHLGRAQMIGLSLVTWLDPTLKVQARPRRHDKWQERHEKFQGLYCKLQEGLVTAFLVLVSVAALSAVSLIITGPIYALVRVITGLLVHGEPISEHLWQAVLLATGVLVTGTMCVVCLAYLRRRDKEVELDLLQRQATRILLHCDLRVATDRLRSTLFPAYYTGEATLPRKVYEGDSHSISIGLEPALWTTMMYGQLLDIQDTKSGKSVALQILRDSRTRQFLEIELLAAGLEVDGQRKLRQDLTLPSLSYHWSCYFPNSGNHVLTLVLRLVDPSATIELGTVEHRVRVAKLDHLTKRQVWLLATLAGVASGGLTIAEVLHRLGVW